MLLSNNTDKVIELLIKYDDLNSIDKLRLAIYLLENKNFYTDFDTTEILNLLKEILSILDSKYTKILTNFSKYKTLLFLSAKYLELSLEEKKHFSVEMVFNIYTHDFEDKSINNKICNNLQVFDYSYSVLDN